MEPNPRVLRAYETASGKSPFDQWMAGLRDRRTIAIVSARLIRLEQGNFGHCKSVGKGVLELKIDFGPGYRVYFAEDGTELVLLLIGGNKATQPKDIELAHTYWTEYKESKQ